MAKFHSCEIEGTSTRSSLSPSGQHRPALTLAAAALVAGGLLGPSLPAAAAASSAEPPPPLPQDVASSPKEAGTTWLDAEGQPHLVPGAVADRLSNDPGVVWSDAARTMLMFVPERLLDRIPLDQLPIHDSVLGNLKASLPPGECLPMRIGGGLGPLRDDARSVLDVLARDMLAFVGKVTVVERGYSTWLEAVATMVHVQVEEAFKSEDGAVRPGDVLLLGEYGGSISFRGASVCSREAGEHPFEPGVGQRVFVVGIYSLPGSRLIEGAVAYPVAANDVIEDVGYNRIRVPNALTLSDIRGASKEASDAH
jgi:hypothetical protein